MNETLKFKFLETWVLNFCRLYIILDYSIEKSQEIIIVG